MNLYFIIRSQAEVFFDPLEPFKTTADKDVLAKFRKGYSLVNWNWTCPVNWYLESRNKRDQILLAGKDYDRKTSGLSSGVVWALKAIGTSAGTSDGIVPPSWAHRDGGKPGREWFLFDAQKFQQAQDRYNVYKPLAQQWADNPIPLNFCPEKLSELALALMRMMKPSRFLWVWQFDELHAPLNELRLQGLLQLLDGGCICLTKEAKRLRVPKGPVLKLLFSPTRTTLKRAARHGTILPEAA